MFPELKIGASTGKRGGAPSQEFTRLRREELGRNRWRTRLEAQAYEFEALKVAKWMREKGYLENA